MRDLGDGLPVESSVPHDPALSHLIASNLELRLHQDQRLSLVFEHRKQCRQNQRGRNERDVHGDEVHQRLDLLEGEAPGVGLFERHHTRVLAKLPIELVGPHVDRDDAGGPVLKQAVRKPSGRGANIQADPARHVNLKVGQRAFELQSPAADVPRRLAQQPHRRVAAHPGAALFNLLIVDQDLPRQNQTLGLLPGVCEPPLHQQPV